MKFNYRLLAGVLLVIVVAGACSKKYKHPNTVEPNTINPFGGPTNVSSANSQLSKLMKDLRSTPEKQCVTAGIEQTIVFSKGTILKFHPNSFKDKTGNIINSGNICIEMIEMYKPGDMIANWASTNTMDGQILKSGGQVNIKATKNGEEVYANEYGISFRQPAFSADTMFLYSGSNANEDSIVRWEKLDDRIPPTFQTFTDSAGNTILPGHFYIFERCTKFAIINCDDPYSIKANPSVPRTQIRIKADTSFGVKAYWWFFILNDLNAVVGKGSWIPVGLNATVISIYCKEDGYYYYEKKGFTVTEGMVINIPISPTMRSLDYIKERLSQL